ncbi:hypothetical protein ACFL2D_00370 [Patescibacteria group bacterium]
MANPNLLRQAKTKPKDKKSKLPVALIVSMIIIVLAAGVYFAFFLITMLYDSRISEAEDEIAIVETEILLLEDESTEARNFVDRMNSLVTLASEHTYWSGVLTKINDVTDKQVQYNYLRGGVAEGTIIIEARAANLKALERNMVGLNSLEIIKEARTINVIYDFDPETQFVNVQFDLIIDFEPNAFYTVPERFQFQATEEFSVDGGDSGTPTNGASESLTEPYVPDNGQGGF